MKIIFLLLATILVSCSTNEPGFELKVGVHYPIALWPDSSYIANFDSITAAEIVVKKEGKAPEVSVAPMAKVPSIPQLGTVPAQNPTTVAPNSNNTVPQGNFIERFEKALERLSADPSNPSLAKKVAVQTNESFETFMLRVYGKQAEELPVFVVKSQIESINGNKWNALVGTSIAVPKVK